MSKKRTLFTLALGTGLTIAFAALADGHSSPPEVGARQGIMKNYGFNLGILGAMAKGERDYDAAVASTAAANLAAFANSDQSMLWTEGTDNAAMKGTRALPAIWTDAAGYQKATDALAAASTAMAATSDLAGLQGAMAGVGGACSTCHKAFRAPNN